MKWSLEKRPLKGLREYPKNARYLSVHDGEHLEASLKKFGQCEPLVINTDGTLIGGHQRLRTLRKMGQKTVDVYVPDTTLTEKEVEELNIRLNKNIGSFDHDILANEWDPVDLVSYGFTIEELTFDDLGSADEPGEQKESEMSSMHIQFASAVDLQQAENRIATIVDEYVGAKYKIKVK